MSALVVKEVKLVINILNHYQLLLLMFFGGTFWLQPAATFAPVTAVTQRSDVEKHCVTTQSRTGARNLKFLSGGNVQNSRNSGGCVNPECR